jgi:PAS domain S-box-containing protein
MSQNGNRKPLTASLAGKYEAGQKSKTLHTALILTAVTAFSIALFYFVHGDSLFAGVLLGVASSATLGLYLTRRGRTSLAAAINMISIYISIICTMLNRSGFEHPGLIALPALILAVSYFFDRRAVFISTAGLILTLVVIYLLQDLGIITLSPPPTFDRLLMISIILAVTGYLVWAVSGVHDSQAANFMETVVSGIKPMGDGNATSGAPASSSPSEKQFRHFAQTTTDAILLLNASGRIIFVNHATENILGLTAEQLLAQPLSDFLLKPDFDRQLSEIDRILALQNEIQVHELEGLAKHQAEGEIPIRLAYSAWTSGPDKFVCVILRDLTEQIETQKWLVFQERLGTLGSLVAGVAHDFNNALMPIILNAQIALRETELSQSIRDSLEIVLRQAKHAGELSKQLLSFSTESQDSLQPTNMKQIFKEIEKLLERTLPENISLRFEARPGTYYLLGDPNRLEQAFMNLAINARDAMPEGGRLHMRLSRQEFSPKDKLPFPSMQPGDWIRLDITDTGHGILAEDIPHIFEPFYTTKEEGEGYGLGLAQTYNIIKQHQGFIDVVSRLGRGTTFRLYFPPLEGEEPIDLSETSLETIMGEGQTILVVEDDPQSLQVISEALEHLQYQVVPVSNGVQAVQAYQDEEIDLVLSDMVMPDMDGLQLHRRLSKDDPKVRLVIISGYSLDEVSSELLESGVLGLLKKPVTISTLAGTIFKALN